MARSRAAWLWLALLAVLAFAVVAKALAYFAAAPGQYGFEEQAAVYREHRAWLLTHIACGVLALSGGTLQLIMLRLRVPGALHRWTGGIYAVSVMVGGISALPLAAIAWGGIANTVAFGLLALLWMFTTLQAVRAIRRGAVASHRVWIVRSFAFTLAAVTLRAEVGLLQLAGLSFDEAYHIAPWTCWVLNLLAVEWFRARGPEPLSAPAAAAAS
jgi:uncharacterized membrane protein